MIDNDRLTPVFSHDDVEIQENTETWSGWLKINRMKLRHRLHAGGWSNTVQREIVQRVPGVGVLLYDPALDMVLMVEQFRIGCLESTTGPWKLELVAGLIDTDESPKQVAIREAREEANITIGNMLEITSYFLSPGSSTEYMHLFCAGFDASLVADRTTSVFGLATENEDIRTVLIARKDAEQAIVAGVIDNAMSIIALQWLSLNLDTVRQNLSINNKP